MNPTKVTIIVQSKYSIAELLASYKVGAKMLGFDMNSDFSSICHQLLMSLDANIQPLKENVKS